MNIDKFEMDTVPFEKTLTLRLPSTAMMDEEAAQALSEWNSPLIYAEYDKHHLYYDITGRVPLRSQLNKVMTKREAIALFAAVADALLYGMEKNISPKFILLDSDLVYVSEETGSLRFICVPAVNPGLQIKPLRSYIRELIVNMQYDSSENLEYIGKIINYLNRNKKLNPADFIDYLDSLEQEAPSEPAYQKTPEPVYPNTPEPDMIPLESLAASKPEPSPAEDEISFMPPKDEPKKDVMDVPEIHLDDVSAPEPARESQEAPQSFPYMIRKKNGEKIVINKDEFKIGKIPGMADYLLTDNPAVSRMHAIIHKIDGAYYICDNYSTNSTFLNGEPLEAGKNYILLNGVRINFANEEFTYYAD